MFIEKVKDELYHLKREEKVVGEFQLTELECGARKLEKLHLNEKVSPGQVLEIFEMIQVYSRNHQIEELLVESHSDSLDILLQHQQFTLKNVEKRLWTYQVTHS